MKRKTNTTPYSEKAPSKEFVQKMFDNLAENYDGLNHSMSMGVDKSWRKYAINYLKKDKDIQSILDIATGTGDMAILANELLHPSEIIGIDISDNMLKIAKEKISQRKMSDTIKLINADSESLPFSNNHFDAVISAFALRNFEHLEQSVSEMFRVLKPNGKLVIIDLCNPVKSPMKQLFWCYKKMIMPIIGRIMTNTDSAYNYLPHTMSVIPQGREMCNIFSKAGFTSMGYKRLKFQMCVLYSGLKPQ